MRGTQHRAEFGHQALSKTRGYSASGLDENREHYAGTEHDAESGTDHAQFRQYSTNVGFWMSMDPYSGSYDFTNPQSFNRYTYALNNPLSFVDPSGLDNCGAKNQAHRGRATPFDDNGGCDPSDGGDGGDGGGSSYPGEGSGFSNPSDPNRGSGSPCDGDCNPPPPPPSPDPWDPCIFYGVGCSGPSQPAGPSGGGGRWKAQIPYKICVAAARYAELASIKSYTDKANADLAKTYGYGIALLGPAGYLKYGIGGSPVSGGNLLTSYVAGVFAKVYFITVPSLVSGVRAAANQYEQDVKACGGG